MSDEDSRGKSEGAFRRLFSEARRRRVIRTLVIYAGAAAAIVEAADIFTDPLALPDGTVRLLAILSVCGLPVVVALAWAYDIIPTPGDAERSSRRGSRTWGRHGLVAGATLFSVGAAVALWSRGPSAATAGGPESPRYPLGSIAVLPLEAVGADPDVETLAASLHGRLIDGLSQAGVRVAGSDPARESLRVISRAGVLPFAGRNVPPDSIARVLEVGTIVDGSVMGGGERVHVRLRLIDAATAEQLGVTEAGAGAGDNVALLEAVADSVTRLLRRELGDLLDRRMRLLETRSPRALDHVMWAEARREDFDVSFAAGDLDRARRALADADSLLAEAERLDPEWLEPVVERAMGVIDRIMLEAGSGEENPLPILERFLAHAERAVAMDPDRPEALLARGVVRAQMVGRVGEELPASRERELLEGAESDLRAAARRSARPARALVRLAELLAGEGRLEEAYEYGKRAHEEDPYLEGETLALFRLFEYAFRLDRDEEAARWCREGFERERLPQFWDCRLLLQAWSEAVEPDPDTAWALVRQELAAYPAPLRSILEPRLHALVAAVLARSGMADSARVVLARARESDRGTRGVLLAAAGTHALLGEEETAYGILERLRSGSPGPWHSLARAPELRALRGDARLEELLQREAARQD